MASMLFFTMKIPSPPICRSSADKVTSGSGFSSGSYGVPLSKKVTVTVFGSGAVSTRMVTLPSPGA